MTRVALVVFAVTLGGLAAACGREASPPETEVPTLDITSWTDKTELFMEFPPLVAGQTALYAVHLTRLSDFTAMTEGRPRIEFVPETGGSPIVLQGNAPSRPGVFRVEAASPPAGRYRWVLIVDAPVLADRHHLAQHGDIGDVTIAVSWPALRIARLAFAEARGGWWAAIANGLFRAHSTLPRGHRRVSESKVKNMIS